MPTPHRTSSARLRPIRVLTVVLVAALAAVGATAAASPAAAAAFTVTSTADDGPGSFRQAVADANAVAGRDVIALAPGLGTITLASPITITDDVTILGNGATITRSASVPMLQIALPVAGSVSLQSLTFAGDRTTESPTVVADATSPVALDIRNSRFSGVLSWGMGAVNLALGSITVTDSIFEDLIAQFRGGAIWVGTAVGTSVVTDTLFDDNYSAGFGSNSLTYGRGGAAIAVDTVPADASFLITRSYFHSNQAALDRWESTRGFAVHFGEILGEVVVDSSTFEQQEPLWVDGVPKISSGWSVGAMAIRAGGMMRIVNSTFDEESFGVPKVMDEFYVVSVGSVDQGATFSFEHSTSVGGGTLLIDSNRGSSLLRSTIAEGLGAVNAIRVLAGDPVTVEWSLVSTPHVPAFAIDGPGNQWDVDDMMLAPLADNGGPTKTMMIGPTGPAVGTGMPTALATEPTLEQRRDGFLRRLGSPDVGAVELPGDLPTLPLPTPTPTATPTPTPSPSFNPPTLSEPKTPKPAGLPQTGSSSPNGWVISAGVIGVLGGIALMAIRRRRPTS